MSENEQINPGKMYSRYLRSFNNDPDQGVNRHYVLKDRDEEVKQIESRIRNKDCEIVRLIEETIDTKEKSNIKLIAVSTIEKLLQSLNDDYTQLQDKLLKKTEQLKHNIKAKNAKATKEQICNKVT